MRYEPGGIDFTWERERRIPSAHLQFSPEVAGIIVPTMGWAQTLIDQHIQEQDYEVLLYSIVMEQELAELHREDFSWKIISLSI